MLTEALHDHDRHLPIGYLPLSRQPRPSTHQGPLLCHYGHNQPEKMAPVEFVCLKLMARILCGVPFSLALWKSTGLLFTCRTEARAYITLVASVPSRKSMCASLIIHCLSVLLAHSLLWVQ